MCSDEGRVVDWLLDDARVDATAGLLPRGAAAGEGLRGRAHLAQTTTVPKDHSPRWSPMRGCVSPYRDTAHALCRSSILPTDASAPKRHMTTIFLLELSANCYP